MSDGASAGDERAHRHGRIDEELVIETFDAIAFRGGASANAVAISADGSRLAMTCSAGLVMFDREGAVLAARAGAVYAELAFNADATLLLENDRWNGGVSILDAATLDTRAKLASPKQSSSVSCASKTHRTVALVRCVDTATLWNIETASIERELPLSDGDPSAFVHAACFSPDGTSVVVSTHRGVSLWDTRTGEQLAQHTVGSTVLCIASVANGATYFAITADGRLLSLDGRTCAVSSERSVINADQSPLLLQVSDDDSKLVCVTSRGAVFVASTATLAAEQRLELQVYVRHASMTADAKSLVVTDSDGDLWFVDLAKGTARTLSPRGPLHALVFDGESVLFAQYKSGSRKLVIEGDGGPNEARSIAVAALIARSSAPNGALLFHRGAELESIDWRTGQRVDGATLVAGDLMTRAVRYTEDRSVLASPLPQTAFDKNDPRVVVLARRASVKKATVVRIAAARLGVEAVALSPSGARLAVADLDGAVRVFDVGRAFAAFDGARPAKKGSKQGSKK